MSRPTRSSTLVEQWQVRRRPLLQRSGNLPRRAGLSGRHAAGYRRRRRPARTTPAMRRPTPSSTRPTTASADNGLFCDGAETCDAGPGLSGRHTAGYRRWRGAAPTTRCDEAPRTRSSTPAEQRPPATTGFFCDGTETCDPALDCQAGHAAGRPTTGSPAPTTRCDEATDTIVNAANDGHLRQRPLLRRYGDLRPRPGLPDGDADPLPDDASSLHGRHLR